LFAGLIVALVGHPTRDTIGSLSVVKRCKIRSLDGFTHNGQVRYWSRNQERIRSRRAVYRGLELWRVCKKKPRDHIKVFAGHAEGLFRITSGRDWYTVHVSEFFCDCPHFDGQHPCKHLIACAEWRRSEQGKHPFVIDEASKSKDTAVTETDRSSPWDIYKHYIQRKERRATCKRAQPETNGQHGQHSIGRVDFVRNRTSIGRKRKRTKCDPMDATAVMSTCTIGTAQVEPSRAVQKEPPRRSQRSRRSRRGRLHPTSLESITRG